MLDQLGRKELIQRYDSSVLKELNPRGALEIARSNIRTATESVIYGPQVLQYMQAALAVLDKERPESATKAIPYHIAHGINFLATAAKRTEETYSKERSGVLKNPEFLRAIEQLQTDVSQGVISLIPTEFAMTPQEGLQQVTLANASFSTMEQPVQLTMSGLNYASFTSKTMLNGKRLLDPNEAQNLTDWTEKQIQESMPHLVLSNTAMGQIVSALLQQGKLGESFSIVDTGSGTGCTLAGSILGVNDALAKNANIPRLSMTGIEGTRRFFYDELSPFADTATEKLDGISLEKNLQEQPKKLMVETGQFNLVYGDILKTLQQLEFSEEVKEGVVIITANYVWHRLPTSMKDTIIEEVSKKAPNAIFLVADLVQNGSEVNRRYFNFRDNGLLNCGNRGLNRVFTSNDYRLIELNEKTAPQSMDSRLAEKIGQGITSDSIFYIAYQGKRAAELVENW